MKWISNLSSALCLAFLFTFLASGCAGIARSHSSGYSDRGPSSVPAESRDRRSADREEMITQMGLPSDGDFSERQSEALTNRLALKKAEQNLEGKREREQYYRNKPYMRNDRDRLDFLARSTFESRQQWLNTHKINPASTSHSPEIQYLIDSNDISIGMTKAAVKESWGEPDLVEVSGNPLYGNERWHYTEQAASAEGYQTQKRMVTFDAGRVSGWETR